MARIKVNDIQGKSNLAEEDLKHIRGGVSVRGWDPKSIKAIVGKNTEASQGLTLDHLGAFNFKMEIDG